MLALTVSSAGELDDKELGDCVQASSSTDLCLPALSYLHGCSQVGERASRPRPPPLLSGQKRPQTVFVTEVRLNYSCWPTST